MAPHQRDVTTIDRTARDLLHQTVVRALRSRDDEQAAGVTVEAVHDAAAALGPAGGAERLERLGERPGRA